MLLGKLVKFQICTRVQRLRINITAKLSLLMARLSQKRQRKNCPEEKLSPTLPTTKKNCLWLHKISSKLNKQTNRAQYCK